MANRKQGKCAKTILAAMMSLVLVICVTSCSGIVDLLRDAFDDDNGRTVQTNRSSRHSRSVPTDATYETLQPTGTYSPETYAIGEYDIDYIKSICVYTVWYDATEDNPVTENRINKADAFAIKGVFYFSTPLTTDFEAKLYKDGEEILSRTVSLVNQVTAEADFSAGLEGWGTFDEGDYFIALYFEDELVTSTATFVVEE